MGNPISDCAQTPLHFALSMSFPELRPTGADSELQFGVSSFELAIICPDFVSVFEVGVGACQTAEKPLILDKTRACRVVLKIKSHSR